MELCAIHRLLRRTTLTKLLLYAASQTKAERAVWKFAKEQKPHFVINCMNPNTTLGRILASLGATGNQVPSVVKVDIPIDLHLVHRSLLEI